MSVKEYVERLRNTRTFTFDSTCGNNGGGVNDDIGNFDCFIPPHPFPQNVISSRGIFKMKSFYVTSQSATERVSESTTFDDSGFFVQINGLGLNQGVLANARSCGIHSQAFPIYNKDGGSDNTKSLLYQRNSGGDCNCEDVLCSNPYGTIVNVKVFSMDGDGTPITANVDLGSIITFSIELIPDN